MLPESRKKLIISVISIIVIIIVVFLIAKLSAFIKSKNTTEPVDTNDDYANLYDYYGFMKDSDSVYHLYGLKDGEEMSLDLKTFYDIQDIIVKDNHLIIYSDALNEIRYNKNNKAFHFYELNSSYSSKYKIKIASKYLITYKDNTLAYLNYTDDLTNEIKIAASVSDYLVTENMVYYVQNGSLYSFDLTSFENTLINNFHNEVMIKEITDKKIYYELADQLYFIDTDSKVITKLEDIVKDDKITFIVANSDGFIYKVDNILKSYSIKTYSSNVIAQNFTSEILTIENISDNEYLMSLKEEYSDEIKNVIINFDTDKITELTNNYVTIKKVG